jgi:hypothetical protein
MTAPPDEPPTEPIELRLEPTLELPTVDTRPAHLPAPYFPYSYSLPAPRRRRRWPWVLVFLAALGLACCGCCVGVVKSLLDSVITLEG